MKASIITIGDELLIGQVIDTNSAYIAKKLEKIGCKVVEKISISDDKTAILKTLKYYQNTVDLVIITGGLGPTKDDITKQSLCDFFEDQLIENQEVLEHITQLLYNYYQRPISDINKQQAFVPSKCKVLFNNEGTAPGMVFQKERTTYISLPGVPSEMKNLIKTQVIPFLKDTFSFETIIHKTIVIYGIGESLLAEKIETWENSLGSEKIKLAYLPQLGKIRLRLTAEGQDKKLIKQKIDLKIKELQPLIQDYIFSENEDEELIDWITSQLTQKHLTIAVAESFTGGILAHEFTKKAGASAFFKGGIVTYATETKIKLLGVNANTINKYGVVSEEVAKEMAKNAKRLYESDYALATTGNAGPSQGDENKAIGVVCLAIATPTNVYAHTFNLGTPRSKVIASAVQKILQLLQKELNR